MTSILILSAAFLASGQLPIFDELESRAQTGRIDAQEREILRVTAVRHPDLLPADLKQAQLLERDVVGTERLTSVLFEAVQRARTSTDLRPPLRRLLAPPADLANVLESTTFPLRVSYSSSANAAMAQQVLEATEHSWQVMTSQWGFPSPIIEWGTEKYRVYVDDTGWGGGAYTAPYEYHGAGDRSACYSYIVIDDQNPSYVVDSTMAHELNHAMQATLDCMEIATFMENTSTYIMSQVYPEALWETTAYMDYFQEVPWRALDYMNQQQSDGYEYGGALFATFLAESYAPPAGGPVLLRQIWEAAMQPWPTEEGVDYNEPDYYDAIEEVAPAQGGPPEMRYVLLDFCEARFFVGSRNDNLHLDRAFEYPDVTITAALSEDRLPATAVTPQPFQQPAPYGTNLISIQRSRNNREKLRLRFDGDDQSRWAVRVVSHGGPGALLRDEFLLDRETWTGELVIDDEIHSDLLVIVGNLGTETYDPDDREWPTSSYQLEIDQVFAPAVVNEIDPAELKAGTRAFVRLIGSGFVDGDAFDIVFEEDDLIVREVVTVNATEVEIDVDIDDDAAAGARTLIVTNGDGTRVTVPGMFKIAAADDTHLIELPFELPGFFCQSAAPAGGLPLLALLPVALWRSRRSRRG